MATKKKGKRTTSRRGSGRGTASVESGRNRRTALVLSVILVFFALAAVAVLIFEFCSPYKPSNGFKKETIPTEEQTDTVSVDSGGAALGELNVAEQISEHTAGKARSYVSTYSTTETVTLPCDHLPQYVKNQSAVSAGMGSLLLQKSFSERTLHVKDRVSGVSNNVDGVVYFAEYAVGGRNNLYFTTGIWCIHGINNYFKEHYGYTYSDFEINVSGSSIYGSGVGVSDLIGLSLTETYDSETDTLRLECSTSKREEFFNFPVGGSYNNDIYFIANKMKFLPPDPVKEGYTFTGWYTDEACTVPYEGYTVTDDMTLYAGWKINTYTLTLNGNGGKVSQTTITCDYNRVPEIPIPTRTGYNFLGWKTSDGTMYDITTPLTQDITLTAQWEIKRFTVTFIVDGVVYYTMTVEYGTKLAQVTQSAEPNLFALYAVDGEGTSLSGDSAIDGDITVHAEKGTTAQKLQGNWKRIIVAGVSGAVLIASVTCIIVRIKRSRR